jgi:predicted DNA-binding transcriptional regulator
MFDEITKSFQTQISERLYSPIMGSFVISWSLWNYKFFVILFSHEPVTHTFSLIEQFVFPNPATLFLKGLLFPILTSVAYIFIYPYPAKFVYEFTRKKQKEIIEIRQRIEEETLLTVEDSRKIRSEFTRLQFEHESEIDQLNNEINRLKEELKKHAASPEKTKKRTSTKSPSAFSLNQTKILRIITQLDGVASKKVIAEKANVSKIQLDFDLEDLNNRNLISLESDPITYEDIYRLTQDGRGLILRAGIEKPKGSAVV